MQSRQKGQRTKKIAQKRQMESNQIRKLQLRLPLQVRADRRLPPTNIRSGKRLPGKPQRRISLTPHLVPRNDLKCFVGLVRGSDTDVAVRSSYARVENDTNATARLTAGLSDTWGHRHGCPTCKPQWHVLRLHEQSSGRARSSMTHRSETRRGQAANGSGELCPHLSVLDIHL